MNKYYEEVIKNRRVFRPLAEIGFMEMQTTIEIIKYLKNLGFNVKYGKEIHKNRMGVPREEDLAKHFSEIDKIDKNVDFDISEIAMGYTGAIVDFDTSKPGPKIGFRFDIDALLIKESTDADHIPYKEGFSSKFENTAHACGHDGHIAMGLTLCKYIMENKDSLKGSFRIIFQPAEEGVRGGKSMTEAGSTKDLDYLFSAHIGMNEEVGSIGVGTVGFLATKKINVEFKGVSAHAANNPQDGRNALLAASSLALNLNSFSQHGSKNVKINVGTLKAGGSRNVIADYSYIEMEIRAEDKETLEDLSIKLENAVKGSSLTYGVEYTIAGVGEAINFESIHPEFKNKINEELIKRGFKTKLSPNISGSEDVSFMLSETEKNGGKAIHFLIGADLKAPHHNNKFDYNEDALILGFDLFKSLIDIVDELN